MALVRPQDVSFMAGGAVAAREGVFVRRTSPTEDVPEVFTRSTVAPRFDENGVVKSAAVNVPRVNWRDYDRDGVYEQAVLPIQPQTTNVVEFNVPGGAPSSFELIELDAVTNLAGEYGIRQIEGGVLSTAAPSNWDPDEWSFGAWAIPEFDNTDGANHDLFTFFGDASNSVWVRKLSDDRLEFRVTVATVAKIVNLTLPFSAGSPIFIGGRLSSGTMTLYADTDSDDTLETASVGGVASFGSFSWTIKIGTDGFGGTSWEGAINLALLDDGSSADPITDRFDSGDGGTLESFLESYVENLVFMGPDTEDGIAYKWLNWDGTDLLAGAAEGAYLFDGVTDDISFGNQTFLDGTAAASFLLTFRWDDASQSGEPFSRSFVGADNRKQFTFIVVEAGDKIIFIISTDLVGGVAVATTEVNSLVEGAWHMVWIRFDGAGAANADRLKISIATRADSDRKWGAFDAQSITFSGNPVPATFTTPAVATDLMVGRLASGQAPFDGAIDDLRINPTTALSTTVLDAQIPNEANPAEWPYWWPFDGNANGALGGVNGTPSGPTQIADGRHHLGRLERYDLFGNAFFDGANDAIDFADDTIFDAVTDFAMWGVFTLETIGVEQIFGTFTNAGPNNQKQIRLVGLAAGGLRFDFALDDVGGLAQAYTANFMDPGKPYAILIFYDGGGATNADRFKISTAPFDEATGAFGAWTDYTLNFVATTIPAAVWTPGAATALRFGLSVDNAVPLHGFVDDWRVWLSGNTPSFADLKALAVYDEIQGGPAAVNSPDHWWDFRSDFTDREGALDGTPTGAFLWGDGRWFAEGWTYDGNGEGVQQNRSTGSDEGQYAFRVNRNGAAVRRLRKATLSISDGKWYVLLGAQKVTAGGRGFLEIGTVGFGVSHSVSSTNTAWENNAIAGRANANTGAGLVDFLGDIDGESAYFDDLRFAEVELEDLDTETLPGALPMISGKGGAWGVADASSVTASVEGIPLPFDTSYGTTIVKLESGPAGSGTRRYMIGLPGDMNGFSADTLAGMVVGIYVPVSSEIEPAEVTTHATDDVGSDAGDVGAVRGKWEWLWVARTWNVAATEAYFEVRFADGVSLTGADEVIYMAIPTVVAGGVPLVPIPQATEGTSTREEEVFYAIFEVPPGAMGLFVEAVIWDPGVFFYVGQAGDTGARLLLVYLSSGKVLFYYDDGVAARFVETSGTVSPGDTIKVLGNLLEDGQIELSIQVGSGSQEDVGPSAALALPDDWGDQRAYLGSGGGSNFGTAEIIYSKIVRGSNYTLAEVDAVK